MPVLDPNLWPRLTQFQDFIDLFPDYLRSQRRRRFKPKSITRYYGVMCQLRASLLPLGEDIGPLNVTKTQLLRFSDFGVAHFLPDKPKPPLGAPSTSKLRRVVLRVFYEFLASKGLPVPNVKEFLILQSIARGKPRPLTLQQMEQLLASQNTKTKEGLRNTVMIDLFWGSGVRVSELSEANIGSVDLAAAIPTLTVNGKGDKERMVYLTFPSVHILKEYLKVRKSPGPNAPLITGRAGHRLTPRGIQHAMGRIKRKAGLNVDCTPHNLRHTFASHLWAGDCDIRVIQELLGHEDLNTTNIYTQTSEERTSREYAASHPRNRHGSQMSLHLV